MKQYKYLEFKNNKLIPKTKRVIFVNDSLLKYGKKEQLNRNGYLCECGISQALETKYTIWVKCEHCKKNQ